MFVNEDKYSKINYIYVLMLNQNLHFIMANLINGKNWKLVLPSADEAIKRLSLFVFI